MLSNLNKYNVLFYETHDIFNIISYVLVWAITIMVNGLLIDAPNS